MVWTTSTLSAELEKMLSRISNDLVNTLANLDGNQKDIDSGTHIRIPMDAGYVNYFKSPNFYEISIWLKERVQTNQAIQQDLYNTKSDEL